MKSVSNPLTIIALFSAKEECSFYRRRPSPGPLSPATGRAIVKGLKLKKHGYPPKSVFRRGLDILRRLVTNFERFDVAVWRKVIKLLSCSW